jgi:hypothetical protein
MPRGLVLRLPHDSPQAEPTCGAVKSLLCNLFYRGEVVHGETVQPGEHKAIVDEELWNAFQARLAEQRTDRRRAWRMKSPFRCG